jgi:hypothetical protein
MIGKDPVFSPQKRMETEENKHQLKLREIKTELG